MTACDCSCHAWSGPFRQTCRGCGHGPDTSANDPRAIRPRVAPWIAARRDLTDAQKLRMQAAWDRAQAEKEGR